jgi:hypothetical protein
VADVKDLPEVHRVLLDSLQESASNPRMISDRAVELLALVIKRFGWKQPLVADGTGVLIAGHTRLRAARRLGLTHAPVIYADDLTPAEVDAYRIADNRTHDFTGWDFPELVKQLDQLADEFGDVLALTDWQGIIDEFDAATAEAAAELELPDGAHEVLDDAYRLMVCFTSKDKALAAEAMLMEIDGVFDVRHKIKQEDD